MTPRMVRLLGDCISRSRALTTPTVSVVSSPKGLPIAMTFRPTESSEESPSGGSAGIGFAIPVNTVIEVVPQLIAFGKIMRPVLGVELASDRWLRRYRVEGVPIVRTYRGFPAETAGMVGARRGSRGEIILGDVITEIDGERVANNDEFLSAMEKHRVGDTIDIVTTREGEEKRFSVELSEVQ